MHTLICYETLFNYLKLIIESWYNLLCITHNYTNNSYRYSVHRDNAIPNNNFISNIYRGIIWYYAHDRVQRFNYEFG